MTGRLKQRKYVSLPDMLKSSFRGLGIKYFKMELTSRPIVEKNETAVIHEGKMYFFYCHKTNENGSISVYCIRKFNNIQRIAKIHFMNPPKDYRTYAGVHWVKLNDSDRNKTLI